MTCFPGRTMRSSNHRGSRLPFFPLLPLAFLHVLLISCPTTGADGTTPEASPRKEAFFDLRKRQTEYAGPGRLTPPPEDIAEVLIGYFGPCDPEDPESGGVWLAAKLAVEEANQLRGYQGKLFRLVPGWSENPWGTGVKQVVGMVYDQDVWAIIGGVDGPSTHLAEQVAVKARLPLVSSVSTDKTVNLTNVPWMFSLVPGDHLQAPLLAGRLWDSVGRNAFVLMSADDHDSRLFTAELEKSLTAGRMAPKFHFKCKHTEQDVTQLAARVIASNAAAAVVVASASQSARLALAIRGQGFTGTIFGGPTMGRSRFSQEAGMAAEGVVFPLLYDHHEKPSEFVETFKTCYHRPPDYADAHTYDAVRMLIDAIRDSGLNRAKIRDSLGKLSPWKGVAGTVKWDPSGSNARTVQLGTIRHGEVIHEETLFEEAPQQ